MELIEIGDTIWNSEGDAIEITKIESGRYGLLCSGTFEDGVIAKLFILPELPPNAGDELSWYGWPSRETITLANKQKVGIVARRRSEKDHSLEAYDAQWQRTRELQRDEQMAAMGESDEDT